VALLLELLEVAGLELPRELRETEHRKALQGVPDEAYGWDLPLAPATPSRHAACPTDHPARRRSSSSILRNIATTGGGKAIVATIERWAGHLHEERRPAATSERTEQPVQRGVVLPFLLPR
jgi:hypothetical protein